MIFLLYENIIYFQEFYYYFIFLLKLEPLCPSDLLLFYDFDNNALDKSGNGYNANQTSGTLVQD